MPPSVSVLRAIAREHRRFGWRRLHVLLRGEGYPVNFRLYREERLAVRRPGGRKRAIGTRAAMTVLTSQNDRWSLGVASDQLMDGRRFRIPTLVPRPSVLIPATPRSVACVASPHRTRPTHQRLGPRLRDACHGAGKELGRNSQRRRNGPPHLKTKADWCCDGPLDRQHRIWRRLP